jgi:hypothetical protein
MKRILLTLIVLIIALPALLAQAPRSMVKIRVTDNSPIMVGIDRRLYNERSRVITIDNLPAGRHRLTIYKPGRFTRRDVLYQGSFTIQPGTFNYIVVDRFRGTVRINRRDIADADFDKDNTFNEEYDDKVRHYPGNSNDRALYANILTDQDMEDLRTSVAGRITDTEKLKLMKSVLNKEHYSTEQVKTMLLWLDFDSSRLDLAKWAHENVVDKREYWKLESVFSFSSTKEEFQDFLDG